MASTNSLSREVATGQREVSSTQALHRYLPLVIVGIAIWLGCFYGLNAAGLFDRDEGLYATASRQMIESGDWLIPRIGPDVRFAKPPLIYWLQAPSIGLLGATPFAVRFPSALAAALTALLLWWWAKRQGAERVGRLAAIIYVLCPLTMGLARQSIIDSVLALCFTVTIIGWIEGYRGSGRGYLLMAAGMAVSMLAKGIPGVLLPLGAFVLWLIVRREPGELKRVPWLIAIPLFLLIAVPWHWVMWRATGDTFIQEYFLSNHVKRFLGQAWGHVLPFWFYVPILLGLMFPWSIFAPYAWWQSLRSGWRSERRDLECVWAMWAVWALVVFVFFSISQSKLPGYIQPTVTALSLLTAVRLESLWQQRRGPSKWEGLFLGIVGIVLGVALTAIGIIGRQWLNQPGATLWGRTLSPRAAELIPVLAPLILVLGILFLAGTIFMLARWRDTSQVVTTAGLIGALLIILLVNLGLPAWNNYNIAPLHNLGRRALPALERGEPLVIYDLHPTRTSLRYVVGHTPLVTETNEPQVLQQVMSKAPSGYILTERDAALPASTSVLRQEASARDWVLWRYERP